MKTCLRFAFLFASVLPACAGPLITKPDLSEFDVKGAAGCWNFKDEVLTGESNQDKKGSTLWTKNRYKDFTIEGDFRYKNPVDSGIFIRQENDQIQLGISWSLQRDMTCSPYIGSLGKYPVEANVKGNFKDGDWNHFIITAKGNRYVVTLNGSQVLDYSSKTSIEEGPIGFQVHPGVGMKVEFRNLTLKPEPSDK